MKNIKKFENFILELIEDDAQVEDFQTNDDGIFLMFDNGLNLTLSNEAIENENVAFKASDEIETIPTHIPKVSELMDIATAREHRHGLIYGDNQEIIGRTIICIQNDDTMRIFQVYENGILCTCMLPM